MRIAPSPTGDPHIGTAYIALFNYAYARKHGGSFILRIEDTDRARYNAQSEHRIFDALQWLGLNWNEGPDVGGPYGPYRQSERIDSYQHYARQLVADGHAYYCFCTPERLDALRKEQIARKEPPRYDRLCLHRTVEDVEARLAAEESWVIRMRAPQEGSTSFEDPARGTITIDNRELDDQVLLKSDGFPTYHLAVVVDDHLMGVTLVCRAEEWIPSTTKHVLLYRFFGWEQPAFVHMPLLRNADKSKISKRKNHTSLEWYRAQGFLSAAMINYLALQGWSMPDGRETFSLDDFISEFTFDRVSTGAPIFDIKRLDDLNGQYIRALSTEELAEALGPWLPPEADPELVRQIVPLIQTRINRLSELDAQAGFFFHEPDFVHHFLSYSKQAPSGLYKLVRQADPALPDLENAAARQAALAPLLADPARCLDLLRAYDPLTPQPGPKDDLGAFVQKLLADPKAGKERAYRLAVVALLQDPEPDEARVLDALIFDPKLGRTGTYALLRATHDMLETLGAEEWTTSTLDARFRSFSDAEGVKLRQPTDLARVAITGSRAGPPLFESMEALGRDRCLARIARALALGSGRGT